MTREEMKAKMAELESKADAAIKKYNELLLEGKYDAAVEEEFTQAINEYTSYARRIAFEDCAAAENPMHEACKRLFYPTIKAKDKPVEEGSKIKIKDLEPASRVIDLKKLKKHCGGKLGANSDWVYAIEKFNLLLTAQKAKDLGIDPKKIRDSYAMADISREYDLGKNPGSKKNLLDTLTKIVQMMLGDGYKPDETDVNYLMSIYGKKGRRALTVSCANHNHMIQYIQEICHRILTGGKYDVDYKRIKK